jgi:hypothetical protein
LVQRALVVHAHHRHHSVLATTTTTATERSIKISVRLRGAVCGGERGAPRDGGAIHRCEKKRNRKFSPRI